jgi:hypothetical protein
MSGAQTSPFPDYNQLMAANAQNIANAYAPERNRLFVQQAAQEAGAREMTAMANASQGLLSLPDEATRAQAYPEVVRYMQSLGFAKNAPPTYPGEQALQQIRARGLPVEQQFNLGIAGGSALSDQLLKLYTGGGVGTGTAATGASGDVGPAVPRDPKAPTIGQQANNPGNLSTGVPGSTGFITAADGQKVGVFPDVPTGVAAHAYQLARYAGQGINTVQDAVNRWVSNPSANTAPYVAAVSKALGVGPGDKINLADPAVQKAFILAQQPYESGRPWLNPADVDAGIALASSPNFGKGVAARTGGTNFAGPGVPTGPTAPAPAVPAPTAPAPVPTAPPGPVAAGGTVAEQPGNQPLINQLTSVGGAPPAIAAPVVAAPAVPAPAVPAPPAPPAPTSPQPQPTATATLPHASEVPTGMARPQAQQAQALLARAAQIEMLAAQAPHDLRAQATAKAMAADLKTKAQMLLQAENVVQTQEGQLDTLTGKITETAKPLANYRETSPGSGIWIGGPGTEPKFQPPGRLVVSPDGTVWQTGVGGATVLSPSDPVAIGARKAAEAAGTAAGQASGKLPSQLADQGRNSAQAIGNIDYGLSQLEKAKAAGINTGYFAPWLGTVAAIGKSLGISPSLIGVDPAAVGNIQTAQKTLAVVSGAILQQVLGSGSQITDAKIQHFIHAQPGIETDPDAVNRVLNWARSQFVYEREMAQAGMKDASATGILPPGWQAKYYAEHGFAPIYNPETGHMEQPEGREPSREAQKTVETAPVNPANRQAGTIYSTPKGPMKWTGSGWIPVQ